MKTIILIILMSMMVCGLHSQTMDRFVISSFGSHSNHSGLQVDATLGEVAIQTKKSKNLQLTQGFHQNELEIITSVTSDITTSFEAWPIPTEQILTIQMDHQSKAKSFCIYNQTGIIQSKGNIKDPHNTTIDLIGLNGGAYILALLDKNSEIIATKTIMKIN